MDVLEDQVPLEAWGELVRELPREDFAARHRHPFLVQEQAAPEIADGEERFSETLMGAASGAMTSTFGDLRQALVQPVVKADSREFAGLVNVGRTANNDLVLEHSSISKFHAYFSRDIVTRRYQVADAGSTNGTFVNERRIAEGEAVLLGPRDLVGFGGAFAYRFHEPGSFHELVRLVCG